MRSGARWSVTLWLAIFAAVHIMIAPGYAHTPESAAVKTMVRRAVRYLTAQTRDDVPQETLMAMALFKAGEPLTHPKIQSALAQCKEVCSSSEKISAVLDIYATSVVGIFLAEIDPSLYKPELYNIITSLEERQKPFGAWGYPQPSAYFRTGDTSMTQYVVLCSWVCRNSHAGEMPRESIRKVTNWLLRTQDPSGAWGYQGNDPGIGNFNRRNQDEVRHSLSAAGLGSVYICAHMLGLIEGDFAANRDETLPPALKPVILQQRPDVEADTVIDVERIKLAIRDGTRWYQANYRINPQEHPLYYLYALERYQSFKELAEKKKPREPKWYNDGVNFLRSIQGPDGSWDTEGGDGRIPDTCFGILFLMRSTQKTLQATNQYDGLLTAGRGLPSNTTDIKMKSGAIVRTPYQYTADALLEILEATDHPDLDDSVANSTITLSEDPVERRQQLQRLRRLAKAEEFNTRMAAVNTLATTRDLDNVPPLIYALSDPDVRVARKAREGLRFISRKFGGFGLSDTSTPPQREAAINAWKQWYLAIRPDAYFPE